jgi:hypothetical protein
MVLEEALVQLVKKVRREACKYVAVGEIAPEGFIYRT